jgi:hypothetical protein
MDRPYAHSTVCKLLTPGLIYSAKVVGGDLEVIVSGKGRKEERKINIIVYRRLNVHL